jgi:fatty acid desaturase
MSREERRNYERMMRNVDRGPSLPPAAKARAERNAARRAARRPARDPSAAGGLTTRTWIISTLVALTAGYLAFSLQWPNMPFAAYAGAAVAVVAFVVAIGVRLVQRRMPPPPG